MLARYSASTVPSRRRRRPSSIAKSPSDPETPDTSGGSGTVMDIKKWKKSLMSVDTTSSEVKSSKKTTSQTTPETPETTKRSAKMNRWEAAASLMFKKETKKRDQDVQRNAAAKAKANSHVQRMLLGRVKKKSQKKFDVLRNEILLSKQPAAVVEAASKSLAGFRVAAALVEMVKGQLRRGFCKWARLHREATVFEKFQNFIDGLKTEITHLKEDMLFKQKSVTAFVERAIKQRCSDQHRHSFRQWSMNVLRRKLRRAHLFSKESENRICRRVCMRMLNAKLSAAWEAWIEHNRLRSLLDRVSARWLKQGMVRCLNTWKTNAKESKRLRVVGARVVKRMLQRKIATMFDTWVEKTQESVRMKYVGQKIIKRMLQRKLLSCYNTWRAQAAESKHLKLVGARVIKRMLQRTLSLCFNTWSANAKEQLRLRVVCQRVGARWMKAGLVATLVQWQIFVAQRVEDKRIVRTWLSQVENREISSAWRSWKLFVQWDHEQEHQSELDALRSELSTLHAAKKEQEDSLCRRVCMRLLNSKLHSAWSTWLEQNRLKALLDRVGARWLKQGMVRCLNTWKESTKESIRLKQVCKRVAARWHKASLFRILQQWINFTLQRQEDRAIVTRWLSAVENRGISSAWRSWKLFVRASKEGDQRCEINMLKAQLADMQKEKENTVCRRVCMRMLNAKLSAAWEAWIEHNRLRSLLDRVSARWLKQGMVRCLNTWKTNAKESKRLRVVGARVVKRMLQRKIATMFDTWVEKTQESVRMKYVGQKIIKRMLQRKLLSCYNTWRAQAAESKHLKLVGARVIKRMLQRTLSLCFNTWSANAKEQLRLRVVCQRVGARWMKAGLVATLVQWQIFVAQRVEDKRIVRTWLSQVENREISSAWRSWKLFVQWDHEQEHQSELDALRSELSTLHAAKKEQEDSLCRRVCMRLLNSKLHSAWSTWLEQNRLKALLDRVGARWLKQGMVRCLNTWKESTKESIRLKQVCKRVAARWHKASLFRILQQWINFMLQRKKDREVVKQWISSVLNRELSAAYRKWTSVVREFNNADRLAELEASWEQSNQEKVEREAYRRTELIRERNNQLRYEMGKRDELVHDLRRQLTSQTKVGDHMVELTRELAHTKEEYNKVQVELSQSRIDLDEHVSEIQSHSNSELMNFQTQVVVEKQKYAEQMLEERTVWINRVMSLEEKVNRAKEIMTTRKTTILSLRQNFDEKSDAVSELEKLNRAAQLKIKELKFRLRECVADQKDYMKRQEMIENARLKREAEHPTTQRLDRLEMVVGIQLNKLNSHLNDCSETVQVMKELDEGSQRDYFVFQQNYLTEMENQNVQKREFRV